MNYLKYLKKLKKFDKTQRSTFPYWINHLLAFNLVSLNHKMWKPKYLFHDWEKPWLRLLFPYSKVQKWHRTHHRHHLEWLENALSKDLTETPINKFDWEAMMIDWECSRFTKTASPLDARTQLREMETSGELSKFPRCKKLWELIRCCCEWVLDEYEF